MEIEADLFIIFQGWDSKTTENMSITRLLQWHKIAIARNKKTKEKKIKIRVTRVARFF